jgi:hypothetical protein
MATKSFSAGEVLTSSDTNTYLNNGGLVYITHYTVPTGAGVNSFTISNCFSSTYDNYRVVWSGKLTNPTQIRGRLGVPGTTNTGYYSTFGYQSGWAAAAWTGTGDNNATAWNFVGGGNADSGSICVDILAPNLVQQSLISGVSRTSASNNGVFFGMLNNVTQYTALYLDGFGDNLIGGQVTVYGYRKGT